MGTLEEFGRLLFLGVILCTLVALGRLLLLGVILCTLVELALFVVFGGLFLGVILITLVVLLLGCIFGVLCTATVGGVLALILILILFVVFILIVFVFVVFALIVFVFVVFALIVFVFVVFVSERRAGVEALTGLMVRFVGLVTGGGREKTLSGRTTGEVRRAFAVSVTAGGLILDGMFVVPFVLIAAVLLLLFTPLPLPLIGKTLPLLLDTLLSVATPTIVRVEGRLVGCEGNEVFAIPRVVPL